jgi:hypothetical protein
MKSDRVMFLVYLGFAAVLALLVWAVSVALRGGGAL